ncbi:hypothetical protein L484_001556 [Morus notabilis]|uniref:Uncharacterized protein n=1 Tax=Morus notabilis TaxID=981085 RepID=W9RPB0_9ROSA|nr:hypothetical protein L484_001556 [Morus notabilis]
MKKESLHKASERATKDTKILVNKEIIETDKVDDLVSLRTQIEIATRHKQKPPPDAANMADVGSDLFSVAVYLQNT